MRKWYRVDKILMFNTTIVHIANDCGYKILCFLANIRRNIEHLYSQKNSHLIASLLDFMCLLFHVLSLLVSVHDNNGHYKEANVSQ